MRGRRGVGGFALFLMLSVFVAAGAAPPVEQQAMKDTVSKVETELVAKYGEAERARIHRGLSQAAQFWRPSDGDASAFAEVARAHFAGDAKTREALFSRMEFALESYDGHVNEIARDFRKQSDLDLGPIYPFDEVLAGYDPSAHFVEDLFGNRLAFAVLLNFPVTTLADRLREGESWSRRQWAEARLSDRFAKRVPADVNQAISQAAAESGQYIAEYNVWMHHLVDAKGNRLFPPKMRLLSHWNLRDQLKSDYGDAKAGLAKQRQMALVMERIVTQTIPRAVVNNPGVDWDPTTNTVRPAAVKDSEPDAVKAFAAANDAEPDTRYAMLLKCFQAARRADPYSPTAPTLIARRFDENRQIPEERVRRMLEAVLTSPQVPQVARLIEKRLGRKLEPFDVWYAGFKPRGSYTEEELDAAVRKRYPTPEAYKKDIPNLLVGLGFSRERAKYLADHIEVDPARGSGHALGAARRADNSHLRTRVEKDGMNFKGFNIAVHEMGHNVEQTFSLNDVDSTLLQGVPNTAFTEALAFVFQAHDLELLGLAKPDAQSEALKTLNAFWGAFEISGVALVDMAVWHWMYDHPDATPAKLKEATLQICRDLWNRYYAPVLGSRDVVLLGIYSHMIDSFLYLPDYPIGHLIAFQIEQQIQKSGGAIGPEFERMAKIGNVAPDIWMKQATGAPVGPEALLSATGKALEVVGR
jgi:hypothetical protein